MAIPSSSSHALVGGLIGAGTAKAGFSAVVWSGVIKTALAIVLSPALGLMLALVLVLAVAWSVRCDRPRNAGRSPLPQAPARLGLSLFAGARRQRRAEDDGNHRGAALFAGDARARPSTCRLWVVLACQTAMGIGTLMGGWKIVHTMGSKITRLTPPQGFAAETGGAITLFMLRPISASQCRPRTPLPARSSASAPRGDCRRCAGTWLRASSSPGW